MSEVDITVLQAVFNALDRMARGEDQDLEDAVQAMWIVGLRYEALRIKEVHRLATRLPLAKSHSSVDFGYTDRPSACARDMSVDEWQKTMPAESRVWNWTRLRREGVRDEILVLRPTSALRLAAADLRGGVVLIALYCATEFPLPNGNLQNCRTLAGPVPHSPGANAFSCRVLTGKVKEYLALRKKLSKLTREMNGQLVLTICHADDIDTPRAQDLRRVCRNPGVLHENATFWLQRLQLTWNYGITSEAD